MGVDSRFGDLPGILADRVTRSRGNHEAALRERVRLGELPLETCLTKYKGFKPEHAAIMMPRFKKAIRG